MRIQTQHTLGLIAFSLVPLALAMGAGYTWSRAALVMTEKRRLETLGSLKLASLRGAIEAHAQVSHRLRSDFARLGRGDLPESSWRTAWSDWLRGAQAGLESETELAIVDLHGSVIAATRSGLPGRTWSGAPGIEAGRIQPRTVGPHRRPDEDAAVLDAVYEPLTTAGGATVAELAVIGSHAALQGWLFDDVTPGTRATVSTLSGEPLASWPSSPIAAAGDGARVEARFRLSSGGALLTLSTAEERALGPLLVLRDVGLAALVAVAGAVVALAIMLGRAIARPVHALADGARRIGAGDVGPLAPHRRHDEFAPLWTAMDQMRAEVVAARDRVEQLLAERTRDLVGQQQLVGSLFEFLPDVVLVVTPERRIAAANLTARRLHAEAAEGATCHAVLYGRGESCPGCPLERVLAGEPCDRVEVGPASVAREAIVYSLAPIGAPASAALYVGRVVTRERTLQTRLAHHEKMAAVGALAAGVAHEVRNPLASLSSLVQTRLKRSELDPSTRSDLAVVLDHVERIDRTVKSLTYAAREPTSGRRPALLQDLVERVLQLAHYDPRARGVTVAARLDRDAPPLTLDEDAWLQVVLNLVVNALDAVETTARREVAVEVARSPDGVELVVRDTGCGMTPGVLSRATDPLFTTKPPGRGTGLGLHLVREVVEQHGGELRLESAPGEGTTVRIIVPRRPSLAPGAARLG